MICPRCDGQGMVIKASIFDTNIVLYVCDECDATWRDGEVVSSVNFKDFSTLMNSLGYKGLWSELINVDKDWNVG